MLKKALLTVIVSAAVLVFGAANVFAASSDCLVYDEDDDILAPGYCDGRLNAFDIDQSVAIYYAYEFGQLLDDEGEPYWTDIVTSIQLWALDSEGAGQMVLNVPLSQITGAQNVVFGAGYTVSYSPSADTFTVTAPNGYTFTWDA